MTATANGPRPPLPTAGTGYQIGDGNISEPKISTQSDAAEFTTTATITTAQLMTGILNYVGSGHSLTLPLAADMYTALPMAKVGSSFDFSVIATTGTATLVTNTGWTINGRLTTAASTASRYRAVKTGVGTWKLYLIA